ncbi:MAG: ATP synthase subunit I [Desulfatitalea sp.]|nr:ATP synthase subunit I [Desulfatitalea sp.]NNK00958.1 ATP synthase subunit I [Desulfatitalea sp.]
MDIQQRLLHFITRANWVLFALASLAGLCLTSIDFALGIVAGGLIVTINFHLLSRTLKEALAPTSLTSHNVVLVKYYIRFLVSGVIIFILIQQHWINPLGLFIGLSVVVASITLATVIEVKRLICKEAV